MTGLEPITLLAFADDMTSTAEVVLLLLLLSQCICLVFEHACIVFSYTCHSDGTIVFVPLIVAK